jgi:hypothetical protein
MSDRNTSMTNLIDHTTPSTSDVTTRTLTNNRWRGGHFVVHVSTASATTVVLAVTVQGIVPGTTRAYTVLAGNTITSTGVTVLKVFPGATPSTGAVANDLLPASYRVNAAVTSTADVAFTVSAYLAD